MVDFVKKVNCMKRYFGFIQIHQINKSRVLEINLIEFGWRKNEEQRNCPHEGRGAHHRRCEGRGAAFK